MWNGSPKHGEIMARPPTILLLLPLLTAALAPAAAMNAAVAENGAAGQLRVGAAAVVITPPAARRWRATTRRAPPDGVHDDLYAKALVFEQDGRRQRSSCATSSRCRGRVADEARRLIAAGHRLPRRAGDDQRDPHAHRARSSRPVRPATRGDGGPAATRRQYVQPCPN